VLSLLGKSPAGKAELARGLGQKNVSGQLNKVIRGLLNEELIEQTIPEKPQSRFQKYRLTEKGRRYVAEGGWQGKE
jgi:ATP-dependent DNA helicase RecG